MWRIGIPVEFKEGYWRGRHLLFLLLLVNQCEEMKPSFSVRVRSTPVEQDEHTDVTAGVCTVRV